MDLNELRNSLADLGEFTLSEDEGAVTLTAIRRGRSYGYSVFNPRDGIDYSPVFRGWHDALMSKLEAEDNRKEAV